MTETTEKKKVPKGGRKGGAQFPRIDLKQAHEYAMKLVSKTHTGPQPYTIVLKGVFDASGPAGAVRASALKQFGLMEGERTAYEAASLAKQIVAATPEEIKPLLQKACLTAKVFKSLFDTFKSDTVSKAKVRQQAITLGVHPDTADECVRVFGASLQYAGLAEIRDDQLVIANAAPMAAQQSEAHAGSERHGSQVPEPKNETPSGEEDAGVSAAVLTEPKRTIATPSVKVNIDIDPSMDPEKLEKLLRLLKQYGAI